MRQTRMLLGSLYCSIHRVSALQGPTNPRLSVCCDAKWVSQVTDKVRRCANAKPYICIVLDCWQAYLSCGHAENNDITLHRQ